jgi:hypothetical protein
VILHGSASPTQSFRTVRAGRLTAELDGIDLRYVRDGGVEFVRRTYAAVRDPEWRTIEGEIFSLELDVDDDSFALRFSCRHRRDEIDFSWSGSIVGTPESVITLSLDGEANRSFEYARIGFCVLHPVGLEGAARLRGRTEQGDIEGRLPGLVAPQGFVDGVYVPMFGPVSELELELEDGGGVRIAFAGDLWEMEDQRNWTDASFKTYSTPMSLGYPHTLGAKGRLHQFVRIASVAPASARPWRAGPVRVELGGPAGAMPEIGIAVSDGDTPTARELDALRVVAPEYVRGRLDLGGDWERALALVRSTSEPLGVPIELAVAADPNRLEAFDELGDALTGIQLARVLVFVRGAETATPDETTPPELVVAARERLRSTAPVGGGTEMEFCELNRTRPAAAAMDGIAFSIVSQVHASDDLSVAETASAQAATVETLETFADGRPIHVGPIQLRYPPAPGEPSAGPILPESVDPRQLSLFGAAWTVASIGSLARAGAASLTYFETLGWRGLVEREAGSPQPQLFPSTPLQIFPLAHVLADAAEWSGRRILAASVTRPFELGVVAVDDALLVSNLSPRPLSTEIAPLGGVYAARRLCVSAYEEAAADPRGFRVRSETIRATGDTLPLELEPFETVRLVSSAA